MNRIIRHIPNFAYDGQVRETLAFETVGELLGIEWVKDFHKEDCSYMVSGSNLLTVKNDNTWWWVIGKLEKPVDLPAWGGPTGTKEDTCHGIHLTDNNVDESIAKYNELRAMGSGVSVSFVGVGKDATDKFKKSIGWI